MSDLVSVFQDGGIISVVITSILGLLAIVCPLYTAYKKKKRGEN